MPENHLFADVPVKALIENDGKVLLALGAEDNIWELPGGRVNEGEDLEGALKREIKEELNLDIEPSDIFTAFLFKSLSGKNHAVIVYKCRILGSLDDMKLLDGELAETKWVSSQNLSALNIRPQYRDVMRKYFDK